MLPSNLINIQYTSCIKIAGIPILPPLVTEERRKELQEDKEKAIAIENKLKAKRQSIDSGVMTGSYTEIFKNGELPLAETIPTHHPSILDQNPSSSSQTDTDSISGDSFLKSALEDQEFREFFYSTADRIFTDSISAASTTKNNNENTKDNIGFLVVTSKNNDEKIDCQNNEVENTAEEKAAAVKITAYAKGYLTRRLLRTERVQLCIEMIQESLRNALSLQNEQQLQKSELEFHERLAYQLTGSLSELQSIVSAPVAERMAIISADRERLKKPLSRPVSALSTATRKSLLRRQMSLTNVEDKRQRSRPRTSLRSTKSDSFSKSNGINKSSSNTQNGKYAHGGNHQKK